MGVLDQLTAALGRGGPQRLQQIAAGQGDFGQPSSADHAGLSAMLQHVPPVNLSSVLSQVAGRMDPQAYGQHVTQGVNGTDPLGGLESAALGMVASTLMSKLTGGGVSPGSMPGLGTMDPSQMDAAQVPQYAQQNHPDLFGQAADQIGQQQPGLLGALLGHAGLSQGAAALASHFLSGR
jgi:hypothetical protein